MKDLRSKDIAITLILAAALTVGVVGCVTNETSEDDNAIRLSEESGSVTISEGGTYEITGQTSNGQIIIDTEDDVQLVLSDVTIENPDSAAIWIQSEGQVTITLEGENTLINGGEFVEVNDEDPDALIYSPGDLIINGDGTLNLTATAGKGVRANRTLTVESGMFVINSEEGIEATGITINGGDITISASDDGINASDKTDEFTPYLIINDGSISITMADGDTDGIDSNGDITINGGTISINAQSAIDYDGTAVFNGGTLIINGEEVDQITNQFEGITPPDGDFQPDGMTPPEGDPPELPDGERPEPPAQPEDM
ncbi:MAG: carbohydrate-binding domain-containing protein [Saccharofermentans sp.]|nr:carbohydrate-binding domain-containing protein [Saccharofermentans sp.]